MTLTRLLIGIAVAWFLVLSIRNGRADEWDTTDKALFAGFVALQAIDAAQTRYTSRHPDQYVERGVLMGDQPSDARILAVKSSLVGLVYWGVRDMDADSRQLLLVVMDVLSVSVVGHNYFVGVKWGFR